MAYKFQMGAAVMSGSLQQEGDFSVEDEDDNTKFSVSKAGVVSGSSTLDFVGAIKSIGAMASSGSITAGTSFIIGSADLNEADMEKLDGITNGTAAASKAVVLDASKNIATIGTVGCGAITSTGNSAMAQLTTSGRVLVDDTTDATSKTDGSLQTDGGLSVAKAIYNGTAATLAADSGVVTIGSATAATFSAAGLLNINNVTDATSKTDGSLQTDGGLSVAKAIYNGTAATLAADSGVVTIGSATAATFSAAGLLNINNATEATSATDGSLQTDGGLSVVKSAVIGDDLDLLSDSCIFTMGSTSKFALTDQGANNCVMATSGHRLAFGNAGEYITGDGTDLAIVSSGDVDITGDTDVVGGLSSTQASVFASAAGTTTIGSATAAAFTAAGILNINNETDATSGTDGSLQTDGGLSVVKKAYIAGNATLAGANTIAAADTAIAVADDFLYFRDADGVMKRDQWADIATAIAGTGITATAGVLSVSAASGVDAHGDANATLTEAFNYASAAMTADRVWSLPASAGMAVGDVVYVKAGALNGNKIAVTPVGSQTIDGVAAAANLESDGGAISLKYVAANAWMIF
tara:strand:- start:3634 stop:5376 length:1743 start_codon:yes stop_codon:yes gene_type:complete